MMVVIMILVDVEEVVDDDDDDGGVKYRHMKGFRLIKEIFLSNKSSAS